VRLEISPPPFGKESACSYLPPLVVSLSTLLLPLLLFSFSPPPPHPTALLLTRVDANFD